VVFEGAAPPADPSTEVQVIAQGYGKARLLQPTFNTRPLADGTFKLLGHRVGQWAMSANLTARTSTWTLKSITLGGQELGSLIDVTLGTQVPEVVLTFTDHPSELAGALEDAPAGRRRTSLSWRSHPIARSGRWPPAESAPRAQVPTARFPSRGCRRVSTCSRRSRMWSRASGSRRRFSSKWFRPPLLCG
jgi:hypothetical protein